MSSLNVWGSSCLALAGAGGSCENELQDVGKSLCQSEREMGGRHLKDRSSRVLSEHIL